MNTDKAYILGLVIGGGVWGNAEDIFKIKLPFKQWGSYESNPQRAGEISKDIMRMVGPLFKAIYGISISYDTSIGGTWNILCEGDLSILKHELEEYGIACEGEIRKTADISKLALELIDDNLKRRFIAGLADTIGSMKTSHRRFNDDRQMVSFEISGFQFKFVCSLCKLLHHIGCYPDQVLWNHPNFHCGNNPYDKKWKKGFKIRVFLDQYEKFGAFAFASKAISAKENQALESKKNVAVPCESKGIKWTSITCVHCDENSQLLPDAIRGGHYLHNSHMCAVLNCEHAPYAAVRGILSQAEFFINPFPVLVKGPINEINEILRKDSILQNRVYQDVDIKIEEIYEKTTYTLLYGDGKETGYPINQIKNAIAYLIAAQTGRLKGTRPIGRKDDIVKSYLSEYPEASISISVPDLLTVLIVRMGTYAAIVGANNPPVYKKLIQTCDENLYKIKIRAITEDDLK